MEEHSCTQCINRRYNTRGIEAELRLQVRKLDRSRTSPRAAAEVKAHIVDLKQRLSSNREWLKQHLVEV